MSRRAKAVENQGEHPEEEPLIQFLYRFVFMRELS